MARTFITYFDKHYLAKGLAMIRSLLRTNPDSEIFVVCCDDRTMDIVMQEGDSVVAVFLESIEQYDPALAEAKSNRTWVEYMWTLTPIVMLHVLEKWKIDSIAYVDADLYFFSNLDELYMEVFGADIAAIPHRWTPKYEARLKPNGIYNVSWTYATNSGVAIDFLKEWRNLCIEWCYYATGPHKMGDQGYLDDLVPKYNVHSVEHLGANLAPWSQEQYRYWIEGENFIVNDYPLLFYHFHEFKHSESGGIIQRTGYPLHTAVAKHVYPPYEKEIGEICHELANK